MSSPTRIGLNADDETLHVLIKLERVTGIPRREHLRRAVARYVDQAADHLTEAAWTEFTQMPPTAKELKRASALPAPAEAGPPILRKR